MPVETRTTCPYCGVGCGVIATVDEKGDVSVRGDPDHPANFGRLCSKGSALAETLDMDGRALYPMIRGRRASWDIALDTVASAFSAAIRDHGPDAVAFYLSGQLLTEDYYVANKLMKGFIGSANIDTNSRLCMASSVAGHRRAFGSDTVPGTYEDLELADLVVLVGSNMAWCHPVLYQRLAAAKAARPAMQVVVIDPRRTASSDLADLHLALRPDGDVALFNGLLAHLAYTGHIDQDFVAAHTNGFAGALMAAGQSEPATVAAATGLPAPQVRQFFQLFSETEKVVTCYSQGVNQSSVGSDKVNAIINCHLATGRIGRPGMGPFSLTGQPNAMGGREVGGLANMLAAHMSIEDAQDRDRVQRFWQAPAIADHAGLKAVDLFEAVADGRIKALWIMSTNPVVSMPDADRVKAAIEACPFVVVSDIETETDTARLAHVLLPAIGWGEKNGTVTNSERRISRQRAFLPLPGEARPDWWQMAEVGRRLGFADAFAYQAPHEIFAEHAALSAFENGGSRDFDIGAYAGATETDYAALQPFQWPQPQDSAPSGQRFFGDGRFFHSDGRARFVPVTTNTETRTSPAFPFVLNTGRVRDHWHTMTRTGKSARLSAHLAEPFAEIHPEDAAAQGISDADLVELQSTTGGRVVVRALVTPRQAAGAVFVPMHWTDETAACGRIDALIPGRRDRLSGQPALKHAAVSLRRHAAPCQGFAISIRKPDHLPFTYWALARCEGGYRMELAGAAPETGWQPWLQTAFDLPPEAEMTGYTARDGRDVRLAVFAADRLLALLFVSDEPVAVSRPWAVEQLAKPHPDRRTRGRLIAGRPPADQPDKGAILCSCLGIGVNEIAIAAESGCLSVQAIGARTGAGTNCGSCRPEIRKILQSMQPIAAE
ncbi:nitrate reductase [Rhizobium sp. CSW-27]|uniref:nitrate reductase n=1 Tax=Rhizobium sp. CSW-27 TaxID=2839985 RepID=UPI001C0173E0|nr:nitrate reductase [Rhizobium sp. CSW-27]MBT9372873.1 molybdopterin-dependent oxidoreductase [Rhizobium sp. CSW-27]